jgi:hypothetical protein
MMVASLSACSGTDDGGNSSSNDDSGSTSGPTAAELAAELDCTGDSGESENKVSCEFNDSFLGITTYESEDALDADLETIDQMGMVSAVLVGELWIIDAPSASELEAAQQIVGGELRTSN